jgi:hypothetical protein
LDAKGVLTNDKQSIIDSFRLQAQLRPDVRVMVGHISLDFSIEDVDKVDDNMMQRLADDYMRRMHIQNTQYILVRHYDRKHSHCHLVFNRIDNDGHLISDKNDRVRSAKICKELTLKYGLYMAKGKDHVNRERLRGADAVKYQIYDVLVKAVPQSRDWWELEMALKRQGISMSFIYRGSTTDVQGVVFEKDGLHFNGSKIDRRFSFSKISAELEKNARQDSYRPGASREVYDGRVEYEPSKSRRQQLEDIRRETSPSPMSSYADDADSTTRFDSDDSAFLDAASDALDAANTAASVVNDVVGGVVGSVLSVMDTPTVTSGEGNGGGGSSHDEELDDDYYIDEHGKRRRKRRGMHR